MLAGFAGKGDLVFRPCIGSSNKTHEGLRL